MSDIRWHPSASIEMLHKRAAILSSIREFFSSKSYLEVETPIMSRYGVTDLHLHNIEATFRNQKYYLQTSPEYHMKRLLAAGSGPIFQLSRSFRDDELGRWHNPEFTMLEWYKLNVNHHGLMDEVCLFLQDILQAPPMRRISYKQVFIDALSIDPMCVSLAEIKQVLVQHKLDGILSCDETVLDQYLFLLMTHIVEPYMAKHKEPIAIYDFPSSQAALAKISGDIGERFEVFYCGVELANGFHELTCASEQRARFSQDNNERLASGLAFNNPDEYLLQALEKGLPPCSGVALGVDRLLALALNTQKISSTMAFDFARC